MNAIAKALEGKSIKTKKGEIIFCDREKMDDALKQMIEKAPTISMEELEKVGC